LTSFEEELLRQFMVRPVLLKDERTCYLGAVLRYNEPFLDKAIQISIVDVLLCSSEGTVTDVTPDDPNVDFLL